MRVELDRQRLCLSLSYDNEEKDKTINLRAFRPTSPPEGGFWTLPTRVRKRWADTKAKVTSAQHQAEARAHAPPPSLKGAPARPRPAPQDEKDASSSGFESKIDSYFVKDGVVQLPVGVMLVLYTEGDGAFPFSVGQYIGDAHGDDHDDLEEKGSGDGARDEGPWIIVRWFGNASDHPADYSVDIQQFPTRLEGPRGPQGADHVLREDTKRAQRLERQRACRSLYR